MNLLEKLQKSRTWSSCQRSFSTKAPVVQGFVLTYCFPWHPAQLLPRAGGDQLLTVAPKKEPGSRQCTSACCMSCFTNYIMYNRTYCSFLILYTNLAKYLLSKWPPIHTVVIATAGVYCSAFAVGKHPDKRCLVCTVLVCSIQKFIAWFHTHLRDCCLKCRLSKICFPLSFYSSPIVKETIGNKASIAWYHNEQTI